MTQLSQRPLVVPVLQQVSLDHLRRAATALADGTTLLRLARLTATEVRALVKGTDGKEYGCTIRAGVATCSCRDALYHGVVCQHATVLALSVLRTPQEEQAPRPLHFVLRGTTALCGLPNPERAWRWPYLPQTEWQEACAECQALLRRPRSLPRQA